MYRIELEPGDVGVYRSVEEMATAIKSGVITTRARIYHQASDKWLPIEFHPHYKQALEIVAGGGGSSAGALPKPGKAVSTPPNSHPAVAPHEPSREAPHATEREHSTHREHPLHREHPSHREQAPHPQHSAHWEQPTHHEHVSHQEQMSHREPHREHPRDPEPIRAHHPAPAPHPLSHAAPQPVSHVAPQPVSHVAAQPASHPAPQPVSHPAPQPVSHPAPQPVSHPAPQPVSQEPPKSVSHAAPQPTAVAMDDYPAIADRTSGSYPSPVETRPEPQPPPEREVAPAPALEFIAFEPAEPPIVESTQRAHSTRPAFRSRLRMQIAGKPRRSLLVALGGMVLVVTTQLGITVPERFGLDIRSLGLLQPSSVTTPRDVAERAPSAPAPSNKPAAKAPAAPAGHQASPSFGSTSAFSNTAPPTPAVLAPPRPLARSDPKDSIVAGAPRLSEIAIGAPVINVGPKPASTSARLSATVLVGRYQAAYAAARAELETGLKTAGFGNLFAIERLTSPQGIRAARLSAGTASAYVAKYRRRETEIEQVYADSFAAASKELNWSADDRKLWDNHQVLQEKVEVAKLAAFLLEQIDSVYGVLSSQEGAYAIEGGTITFQDAKAAHAYAEIRPWLDRKAHLWADTASGTPTTAARVLHAIGSTKLPEGGAR